MYDRDVFPFNICLYIYTKFIYRGVEELKCISINGKKKLNTIRYADDTALVTDNEEKLQKILDEVKYHSSKGGLEMNVKKAKVLLIRRKPEKPIVIRHEYTLAHRF